MSKETVTGEKQKKSKKWIPIAIGVIVVLSLISRIGGRDREPNNTDSTPENNLVVETVIPAESPATTSQDESKKTAGENDLAIYKPVRSAKASYEKLSGMIQQLGTGETTIVDVYSYCEQVKDWCSDWKDEFDEINDESAEAYIDASNGYVSTVYMIAHDLSKYIDDEDFSKLESAKESISIMPGAEQIVNDARNEYLAAAGFTDEEIAARIGIG